MDKPAPIMNRGFAAVVAVPAWAQFMKQATANDAPDWFAPPPDVEKVTICRLSGQRATEACRHGWMGLDFVQVGLTEMPGVPVGDVAVGTSEHQATVAHAAAPRSTVYDDYFPIGSAPTGSCPVHGAAGMMDISGGADGSAAVARTGCILSPSYPPSPPTARHPQQVAAATGRSVLLA